MSRGAVVLASLGVIVAGTGAILWHVLRPPPETDVVEVSRPPPAPEPPQAPEPPPPRRALVISGRVVGAALEPLAGLRIGCGDERVATDAAGKFQLPEAVRPRNVSLIVLRMEGDAERELVRWDNVIAGDALPPSPAPESPPDGGDPPETPQAAPNDMLVPERPGRLRWTVNLGGAEAALAPDVWIRLEDALVEEWSNGTRMRVRGRTRLPDGAHVASSLYFDSLRTIASQDAATVQSGSFESSMHAPEDFRVYSGRYQVHASFSQVLETYGTIEEWKTSHPEVDWDTLQVPEATRDLASGDPEEADAEDRAVGEYYRRQVARARELEVRLKSTISVQGDQQRVFQKGTLASKRKKTNAGTWFSSEFLNAEGQLNEPAWRRFLDVEWRPAVRSLIDEQAARTQDKYTTASTLLSSLLDALLEESYGYSKFIIYPTFGLEAHANDFYTDEERSGDLVRLEQILRSGFQGLERYCRMGQ